MRGIPYVMLRNETFAKCCFEVQTPRLPCRRLKLYGVCVREAKQVVASTCIVFHVYLEHVAKCIQVFSMSQVFGWGLRPRAWVTASSKQKFIAVRKSCWRTCPSEAQRTSVKPRNLRSSLSNMEAFSVFRPVN